MISIRSSKDRGRAQWDWLDSYHTFSFGDYYDPDHMNFRTLRVINEDVVAPGQGFGTHPHKNMEIITYVISGALEHKDSIGTGSTIRPGDIQRMSAGSGIFHSEFNPSKTEPVHLLQIWITPDKNGYPPSYEQKTFQKDLKPGQLKLLASNEGDDNAVTIHQNAKLYVGQLKKNDKLSYEIPTAHHLWIQLIRGNLTVNQTNLHAGDGAAISDEKNVTLQAQDETEFLLFHLT